MKKLSLLLILIASNYLSNAQASCNWILEPILCGIETETLPQWREGTHKELQKDIMSKLIYAQEQSIQGLTVLQFTVDTLGNVIDASIKRSLSERIDTQLLKEIFRYKFVAGELNGRKVECSVMVPLRIVLE